MEVVPLLRRFLCRLILPALAALLCVPALAAEETPYYCFSSADFPSREEQLSGVFLTDVPEEDCVLYCGSRALRPGDTLSAAQLDFLQASILSETDTVAALSYLPVYEDGRLGGEETLYLSLRGTKNQPPVARDSSAETYKNLSVTAAFDCEDPEGDPLIYALKTAPGRGQVIFNRDGTFTYTPNREKVGTDRFTYTVEDSAGNVSEEATVSITIRKPTVRGTYADMAGDPQEFEARFLREEGLFSGEEVGGVLCFGPDKPVSEEEYLMMLMKLTGLEPDETADSGDGWFAPWQSAALRAGIRLSGGGEFSCQDAAVVTAAVLDLPADQSVAVFADGSDPAGACLDALEQAGIPCFSENPENTVTRREAAKMLYAVSRYCRETGLTFPWQ